MLTKVAIALVVLWLLGLVAGYTLGGWVHVLLVVAVVLFLMGIFGKKGGSTPMQQ